MSYIQPKGIFVSYSCSIWLLQYVFEVED